jgi:hypothetical protein
MISQREYLKTASFNLKSPRFGGETQPEVDLAMLVGMVPEIAYSGIVQWYRGLKICGPRSC